MVSTRSTRRSPSPPDEAPPAKKQKTSPKKSSRKKPGLWKTISKRKISSPEAPASPKKTQKAVSSTATSRAKRSSNPAASKAPASQASPKDATSLKKKTVSPSQPRANPPVNAPRDMHPEERIALMVRNGTLQIHDITNTWLAHVFADHERAFDGSGDMMAQPSIDWYFSVENEAADIRQRMRAMLQASQNTSTQARAPAGGMGPSTDAGGSKKTEKTKSESPKDKISPTKVKTFAGLPIESFLPAWHARALPKDAADANSPKKTTASSKTSDKTKSASPKASLSRKTTEASSKPPAKAKPSKFPPISHVGSSPKFLVSPKNTSAASKTSRKAGASPEDVDSPKKKTSTLNSRKSPSKGNPSLFPPISKMGSSPHFVVSPKGETSVSTRAPSKAMVSAPPASKTPKPAKISPKARTPPSIKLWRSVLRRHDDSLKALKVPDQHVKERNVATTSPSQTRAAATAAAAAMAKAEAEETGNEGEQGEELADEEEPEDLEELAEGEEEKIYELPTGGDGGPPTDSSNDDSDSDDDAIKVGDSVNLPGDMYGVVKYIGPIVGKNGTFYGVELDLKFAGKGKNNGDVDEIMYFNTSRRRGVFLRLHHIKKRIPAAATRQARAERSRTPSPRGASPLDDYYEGTSEDQGESDGERKKDEPAGDGDDDEDSNDGGDQGPGKGRPAIKRSGRTAQPDGDNVPSGSDSDSASDSDDDNDGFDDRDIKKKKEDDENDDEDQGETDENLIDEVDAAQGYNDEYIEDEDLDEQQGNGEEPDLDEADAAAFAQAYQDASDEEHGYGEEQNSVEEQKYDQEQNDGDEQDYGEQQDHGDGQGHSQEQGQYGAQIGFDSWEAEVDYLNLQGIKGIIRTREVNHDRDQLEYLVIKELMTKQKNGRRSYYDVEEWVSWEALKDFLHVLRDWHNSHKGQKGPHPRVAMEFMGLYIREMKRDRDQSAANNNEFNTQENNDSTTHTHAEMAPQQPSDGSNTLTPREGEDEQVVYPTLPVDEHYSDDEEFDIEDERERLGTGEGSEVANSGVQEYDDGEKLTQEEIDDILNGEIGTTADQPVYIDSDGEDDGSLFGPEDDEPEYNPPEVINISDDDDDDDDEPDTPIKPPEVITIDDSDEEEEQEQDEFGPVARFPTEEPDDEESDSTGDYNSDEDFDLNDVLPPTEAQQGVINLTDSNVYVYEDDDIEFISIRTTADAQPDSDPIEVEDAHLQLHAKVERDILSAEKPSGKHVRFSTPHATPPPAAHMPTPAASSPVTSTTHTFAPNMASALYVSDGPPGLYTEMTIDAWRNSEYGQAHLASLSQEEKEEFVKMLKQQKKLGAKMWTFVSGEDVTWMVVAAYGNVRGVKRARDEDDEAEAQGAKRGKK